LNEIEKVIKFKITVTKTPELKRLAPIAALSTDGNVTGKKQHSNMPKNYKTPKKYSRSSKRK
jgi:hypothetical protein